MKSEEIREAFLDFFETQRHLRVPSSSLIPVDDPTLLLTTAGMVQFKPYFSGSVEPPNRRLTSSQKSFRTTDVEEVGDDTHLTMFEMLGNFSIGDYFKDEAMKLALDCLETALGLPKERFSVTVHHTDEEARELWQKHGIPADSIYVFGDQENWWGPAGDEGPTGPCAELHYDFRDERPGCTLQNCGPNCRNYIPGTKDQCRRYVELWNLVFMQYYQDASGERNPLPSTGIDTGMGLERLASVKQGTDSFFETDIFLPYIKKLETITGKSYENDPETRYAMRVVTEHARSATFLVADGVVPANDGRGYVLRRVIRRAIRHALKLGIDDIFLGQISTDVIEKMGPLYPELNNNMDFIQTVIKLEEEQFQAVFQKGYALLTDLLESRRNLSGQLAFNLWDTYGFPIEMTQEIASEKGATVDLDSFEKEMMRQRERARSASNFGSDRSKIRVYQNLDVGSTEFLGYEKLSSTSVIVGLISENKAVDIVEEGKEIEVVLQRTPFYPEGGGQIGDAGDISGKTFRIDVHDTKRVTPDLIVHFGQVVKGRVINGTSVDGRVDEIRRQDIARNHTATHMLHASLRTVLGPHVRQAGSLVAQDRLRFDFSHVEAMTDEEINQVQWLVNEHIRQDVSVHKSEDTYTSAIERGALAFFGDKYDEFVRLVEIANGDVFSFEVCGGTHVHRTGELGAVYIQGESSIGAGMRRIEAVSGREAERLVRRYICRDRKLSKLLKTGQREILKRVQELQEESAILHREKEILQRRLSLESSKELLKLREDVEGISVLATVVSVFKSDEMRDIGDGLRDKLGSGVVVLGALIEGRPVLLAMVTADLIDRGLDASVIARGAAKAINGGGGGRPDVAQAGGKDASGLKKAIDQVTVLVRQSIID